jgi:hypothetical protein
VLRWRCIFWPLKRSGFGGKNQGITLEQVAEVANGLAQKVWNRWWHSWAEVIARSVYYQWRNAASYESRRRKTQRRDTS